MWFKKITPDSLRQITDKYFRKHPLTPENIAKKSLPCILRDAKYNARNFHHYYYIVDWTDFVVHPFAEIDKEQVLIHLKIMLSDMGFIIDHDYNTSFRINWK